VREATTNEESTNRDDATEKYSHDKNRETREKSKPTQYLTRFDNLPTSSGQGGEILLIQQSTRECQRDTSKDTIYEGFNPYL